MKKIIIGIILFIVIASFIVVVQVNKNQKTFSPEKWEIDIWEREKMLESLIDTYDLYQMNDKQIVNLLGTNGVVEGTNIVYYVGKTYSGPILFSISFDETGYVSRYGIIVD
ncbi:MAG: hypothetical protein IJF61_03715 [Clostridia bacterium]|nr:hypothetical protein [Clostridia bacterium]